MGWFDVRRTAGAKMEDGSLVPRIASAIRMSMGAGRSYIVRHAIALIYEVKSLQSNKEYIVDLGKKTCNCFTFQSQRIPMRPRLQSHPISGWGLRKLCAGVVHSICVSKNLWTRHFATSSEWGYQWVAIFEGSRLDQASRAKRREDTDFTDVSSDPDDTLKPPNIRRPAGRPKKRRIRHQSEIEVAKVNIAIVVGVQHIINGCT